MLTIDIETARRFILGKQGLWPGRRWRGITGTEQAMRAMEYLQLDPLQIIARSHDITLHSRVGESKEFRCCSDANSGAAAHHSVEPVGLIREFATRTE